MPVEIKVEMNQFTAGLRRLQNNARKVPKLSALDVGHEVLRLSQIEVPHDTGFLQNTGAVDEVGDDVIVGYHTPYAARLHEHPEYRFQKGRKGKYLEDPVRNNATVLGFKFTTSIDKHLGTA